MCRFCSCSSNAPRFGDPLNHVGNSEQSGDGAFVRLAWPISRISIVNYRVRSIHVECRPDHDIGRVFLASRTCALWHDVGPNAKIFLVLSRMHVAFSAYSVFFCSARGLGACVSGILRVNLRSEKGLYFNLLRP